MCKTPLYVLSFEFRGKSQFSFFTEHHLTCTVQKMKFSIRNFFFKCDQIRSFLMIWSHSLKKSLMENFIFCALSNKDAVKNLWWSVFVKIVKPLTICTKNPSGNYLFKVNNRNTRWRCEICSKLTIQKPERRHWHCSGVFIANFEHISHLVLVFLLLSLNMLLLAGKLHHNVWQDP